MEEEKLQQDQKVKTDFSNAFDQSEDFSNDDEVDISKYYKSGELEQKSPDEISGEIDNLMKYGAVSVISLFR